MNYIKVSKKMEVSATFGAEDFIVFDMTTFAQTTVSPMPNYKIMLHLRIPIKCSDSELVVLADNYGNIQIRNDALQMRAYIVTGDAPITEQFQHRAEYERKIYTSPPDIAKHARRIYTDSYDGRIYNPRVVPLPWDFDIYALHVWRKVVADIYRIVVPDSLP